LVVTENQFKPNVYNKRCSNFAKTSENIDRV
jgi:hypothetical protein